MRPTATATGEILADKLKQSVHAGAALLARRSCWPDKCGGWSYQCVGLLSCVEPIHAWPKRNQFFVRHGQSAQRTLRDERAVSTAAQSARSAAVCLASI